MGILAMPLPMVFKGVLSVEEANEFYKYELLYRFPYRRRVRMALITIVLGMVPILYLYRDGLSLTPVFFTIAACAVAPFAMIGLMRLFAYFRYQFLARHFPETEVELDADTIQMTLDQFTFRFPWSELVAITNTPCGLQFFLKQMIRPSFAFPNRVFESVDTKRDILSHAIGHSVPVVDVA